MAEKPKLDKSQFKIASLPLLDEKISANLQMYSGYIPVTDYNSKYFFWLVKGSSKATKNRNLFFWLNGGPGCSSMDGMFLENGPIRFSSDGNQLVLNKFGWWNEFDMVYVDQPPGTGYSLGVPFTSARQVISGFLSFFKEFQNLFDEYKDSGVNIYIGGESFAGTWVPGIAKEMLANQYPVKGLLLGNPWIDPLNQYPSYFDYAAKYGLLTGQFLKNAEAHWKTCAGELEAVPRHNNYAQCERIMEYILEESKDGGKMCINKYDYTLRDDGPNDGCGMAWPPGVNEMKLYLSVRSMIV
jgi:carboxypeptidase D